MRIPTRRATGRMARIVTGGLIVAAVGAVPGAGAVADTQTIDVGMRYMCRFASGSQIVDVRVRATLPRTSTPDRAFRPRRVTVTTALPATAVRELTALGLVSVSATVDLQVRAFGTSKPADLSWTGLRSPALRIPKGGALALPASGSVPSVPGASRGVISLMTDAMRMTFVGSKGGATPKRAGMAVACTPAQDQNTTIVSVPVGPKSQPRTGTGNGQGGPTAQQGKAPLCPHPLPGLAYNPAFPMPPYPKVGSHVSREPQQGCAVMRGYSSIKKLGGSALILGDASAQAGVEFILNFEPKYAPEYYLQQRSVVVSYFRPVRTTFLAFGFMPVTATMEITQVPRKPGGNINMNVVSHGGSDPSPRRPQVTEAAGYASVRLYNVEVNGVPLAVGDNCRTAWPMEMRLRGTSNRLPSYNIAYGGWLDGMVTIPPFRGCGEGEKLDDLFTASVSGPGNPVRVLQGPICLPANPTQANPCPTQDFGLTVQPGGAWKAVDPHFQVSADFGTLRADCRAEARGTFRKGRNLALERIGRLESLEADCRDASGERYTVRLAEPYDLDYYTDSPQGLVYLSPRNRIFSFAVKGPGCAFDVTVAGRFLSYEEATQKLTSDGAFAADAVERPGSNCGEKLDNVPDIDIKWVSLFLNFDFTPKQTFRKS